MPYPTEEQMGRFAASVLKSALKNLEAENALVMDRGSSQVIAELKAENNALKKVAGDYRAMVRKHYSSGPLLKIIDKALAELIDKEE